MGEGYGGMMLTDVGHIMALDIEEDVSGKDEPKDGLTHRFCCTPDQAWCGTDISRAVELDEDETLPGSPECSMCALLIGSTCKRCHVRRIIR